MYRLISLLFLIIIASNVSANTSNLSKPQPSDIPIEAFFKNAKFSSMWLSKDGKHIAALYDTGNTNTLAIMDVNLTKILSKVNFGEYKYIHSFTC